MNKYNVTNYPMMIEFGLFSQINETDLKNNKLKVLVRKETNKSIGISLYCNTKCNSINKNVLSNAKYLKRSHYDFSDYGMKENHYLKISKQQSGKNLIKLIQQQVDRFIPTIDNEIDICIHRDLLNDIN